MKKFLLGLVLFSSCIKKAAISEMTLTETENITAETSQLNYDFTELTTCIQEYWNAVQPAKNDGTAFAELLNCHGDQESPMLEDLNNRSFNPARRLCHRCTEWEDVVLGPSTFPVLLNFLGLDNSSTKAEIAVVHDYLQKFNGIIQAAIPYSYWPLIDKKNAVMDYYHDTYLLTNPPLTDVELSFLIQYTALIFMEDMKVYVGWAYKLYYPGNTPPSANPTDDGLIELSELDPVTGSPPGFTTWDDGFLTSIGIKQLSPGAVGMPIIPLYYYGY